MKKTLAVFLLLLLLVIPALAENSRVVDEADVLTREEEQRLEEYIAGIREKYQFDVLILTMNSIGDRQGDYYAADYYDHNGYGEGKNHDGVCFFYVPQGDRNGNTVFFVKTGSGERIFTADVDDEIVDQIRPYFRKQNYGGAIAKYVLEVEARLESNKPVNRANRFLPIFLGGGLLIGAGVALSYKAQMKTVRRKSGASSYVRDGSFHLSRQQDIYLYTTTTRRRIQSDNNRGGGGGSHGSFHGSSGTHHTSSSYKL
ncbi:MAG: TPM domain-containing protein [Clostridia bacterium]|nr:TPM domain-containing protein [Clostridia bacterium]